jgi:hypothetical protein
MIPRIQRDLYEFIDPDPQDVEGLVEFWYSANSDALSAALSANNGLSLILNVSSFESFERLSKKLYLIADTLILRDTRSWKTEENRFMTIPVPQDYRPGYLKDLAEELGKVRPSPFTLLYRPQMYWTSTTKRLNNGFFAAYAGWERSCIPPGFVRWITGAGRPYFATGRMVYAPFIPPLELELELLKQGVVLPEYFHAAPCFHQKYDWLSANTASALFSIQIPFLDGLDIETISKVKDDNRDAFEAFSRSLLGAVSAVKASFGSEEFIRDIRRIQKEQIDSGINDVSRTLKKVSRASSLRKVGILTGLIGLNAAVVLGAAVASIATGAAASVVAFVADKLASMKERGELKENKQYFLWKLQEASQRRVKT